MDGTPLSASNQLSRTFLFTVLALIFTAIIIVSVYSTGTLKVPHAIIMPSNTTIEVDDNVGILPDTVELNSVLKQFQTTTGVTPSIELVKESTWKGKYRNLEKYALNQYLYKYNDEKHWLVVISYPDNYESLEFIDWRWEGIIGDDCSTAIDAQSEELFTKTMQKYLIRSTPEELAVSLTKAYEEYIPIAMQPRISPISVTIVICAILICIVIVIIQLNKYKNSKLIEKSKKVTGTAKEYNCEYCGRMYISGTVTVCPGCGAPIPAHEESI